jgi:hypothetical protein
MTTFPFLCPCSTYRWASAIRSSGYRLSITDFSFPASTSSPEPDEILPAKARERVVHRENLPAVARRDRRRADPDQDVVGSGNRIVDVLELQNLGRSIASANSRLHWPTCRPDFVTPSGDLNVNLRGRAAGGLPGLLDWSGDPLAVKTALCRWELGPLIWQARNCRRRSTRSECFPRCSSRRSRNLAPDGSR